MGQLEWRRARYQPAIDAFRRAVELNPNQATYHSHLGSAYLAVRQHEHAEQSLRQATSLDNASAAAQWNLATLLLCKSRAVEAVRCLRQILNLRPHFFVHNAVGDALLKLIRPDDAAVAYRKALRLRPDCVETQLKLQRTLDCLKPRHTVQLTSFGGAGTTMLYRFMTESGLDVPRDGDWGIWKHAPEPPDSSEVRQGFRAVYLFGDPINAVLSVFNRKFQSFHVGRMHGDLDNWNDSWNLTEYLEAGVDRFGMSDHFAIGSTRFSPYASRHCGSSKPGYLNSSVYRR